MILSAISNNLAAADTIISLRPVAVVLFPMAAALVVYVLSIKNKRLAAFFASLAGMATFLMVLSLYPLVRQGVIEYRFYELMSLGLSFRVDLLGFIFAFLASLAWMLVLIFAYHYIRVEANHVLYYCFSLLTLGSILGVFVAGDLVTLFLFFEMMTFFSYVLVIGRLNPQALAAGKFYLYLGVAGGLVLLFGIFALYSAAGTVELTNLMEEMERGPAVSLLLIFACFFVGFGIKAGVVPLHLWMPKAYAAGPAIVNALSSGAMIKAGVYGVIRILMLVFTPSTLEPGHLFSFAVSTGYFVMWLGLMTMVVGAVIALLQSNMMKLLAYSSISQMGYVFTGIGAGAFLFGAEEAMGYSGAVLHSFNHTLFKTGFFLIVGIIYYRTGQLEFKKLGGLYRSMPMLTGFFILYVLAIAGVPLFSGYISKTLIHDSLLEAYYLHGTLDIFLAEKVFIVGSALTLCYYLKFFQQVFWGKEPEGLVKQSGTWVLYAPLYVLALFILIIGFFPHYFVNQFVLASTASFVFEPYSIEHVRDLAYFGSHPLAAAGTVILLALLLYIPLHKFRLYEYSFPRWVSIEYLIFAPLAKIVYFYLLRSCKTMDGGVNNFYAEIGGKFLQFCRYFGSFDKGLDDLYMTSGSKALDYVKKTRELDSTLDEAYERTGSGVKKFADRTAGLDRALDKAYESTGAATRRMTDRTAGLDKALDEAYEQTGKTVKKFTDRTGKFDEALNKGYEKAGSSTREFIDKSLQKGESTGGEGKEEEEKRQGARKKVALNPMEWNIKNLNFDSLLLVLMLGIIIFILFYFARGLTEL